MLPLRPVSGHDGLPQALQRALFQPGDLGLGDADGLGQLHLGLAVVVAQGEDVLLPLPQVREGVPQGQLLQPALVAAAGVADLVHHQQGVPAVAVDGLIEGDGRGDGVHGLADRREGETQLLCQLLLGGLPAPLRQQLFLALQNPIGRVPHRAADPNRGVVPQIAADLPADHRNEVRK